MHLISPPGNGSMKLALHYDDKVQINSIFIIISAFKPHNEKECRRISQVLDEGCDNYWALKHGRFSVMTMYAFPSCQKVERVSTQFAWSNKAELSQWIFNSDLKVKRNKKISIFYSLKFTPWKSFLDVAEGEKETIWSMCWEEMVELVIKIK